MKKTLTLTTLFLIISFAIRAQSTELIQMPKEDSLKIWMQQLNVPAVAIGIIQDGKISQTAIHGELTKGQNAPKDALFNVASLTKAITTMLTMKLVSAELWDLDEPLYKYWVDPDVKDDPRHKLLTSRHILSHQTGFVNWRWLHESKKLTFDFEPGTQTRYSGEGFEYLRQALENKFDSSFEDLCQKWVFSEAGMKSSYLTWNDAIEMTRVTQWHDGKGALYPYDKITKANAADDLLTTIEDYTAFGVSVLKKHGMTEKAFKEMVTKTSSMKEKVNMGLGWVIFPNLPGDEYGLLAAGSDVGVNAISLLLPETNRGLVIMTNGDNGRMLVFKLMSNMLAAGKELMRRI